MSIDAETTLREMLIGILSQTGFEGFWEDGACLRCYMRKDRWSEPLRKETERIVGIIARTSASPAPRVTVRVAEDKNWNEAWEKTIRPIQVTDSIIITPSWHEVRERPGQLVLVIDPKMSFGTGYHETTRLSLRLLEQFLRPGMNILDVGTGTGVLAIAAAKLGASSVTGTDIDEWAYRNALENAGRNGVADRVRILQTPLDRLPESAYDVILANIQLDVITTLMVEMLSLLADNGKLVLSGLLVTDRPGLTTLLGGHDLHIQAELVENEWIAAAVERKA